MRMQIFDTLRLAIALSASAASWAEQPPQQALPRVITHYSITSANDFPARDPRDWRLLGSTNGGSSWVILDERTNQVFLERFETKNFAAETRLPCDLFRLEVLHARDPKNANSIQIADIDLRGMIGKTGEIVDLRPGRSHLVTVQGEYAPRETRRMAFDGNYQTKWLDFNVAADGTRRTWIQWQYFTPLDTDPDPLQPITRVADLNARARSWPHEPFRLDIRAVTGWQSLDDNFLLLHDASGSALISLQANTPGLKPGTEVHLTGNAYLVRGRGAVEVRAVPVVNNDGTHVSLEQQSGSVYLRAGRHPIRVEWFNALDPDELRVEFSGPGIARKPIPADALFHRASESHPWAPGLKYQYYEGTWERLPDFGRLNPIGEGITPGFDIQRGRGRREHCGFVFSGYFEVPVEGEYWFGLISDDGSRLFLGGGGPRIEITGTNTIPAAARIPAGGMLTMRNDYQWVQADGEVIFIGEGRHGWEMALQSRSGTMTVFLGTPSDFMPHYLLNSRVRVEGICFATFAPDQQRVAGELLMPSLDHLRLGSIAPRHWRNMQAATIAEHLSTRQAGTARLRGRLSIENGVPILADHSGSIPILTALPPEEGTTRFAEALGWLEWREGRPVLAMAAWRELGDSSGDQYSLPLLTSIEQVHGLSPDEAARGYPVKIRGVVTTAWPNSDHAVVQDGTRGIFIPNLAASFEDWPEVGDFFEIEGRTDPGGFAPVIIPDRTARLGKGSMPQPIHPTWAQLMNGSMDMQYVELRGVVSSVEQEAVWLLMRGGRVKVFLDRTLVASLARHENGVVRIRGALAASWSEESRKVSTGPSDRKHSFHQHRAERAGRFLLIHPQAGRGFAQVRRPRG